MHAEERKWASFVGTSQVRQSNAAELQLDPTIWSTYRSEGEWGGGAEQAGDLPPRGRRYEHRRAATGVPFGAESGDPLEPILPVS